MAERGRSSLLWNRQIRCVFLHARCSLPPAVEQEHHTTFCFQKGRPINIQTLGEVDIAGLHKAVEPEKHWHTIVVNQEALTREVLPCCTKRFGKTVSGALCIVDLKGFG